MFSMFLLNGLPWYCSPLWKDFILCWKFAPLTLQCFLSDASHGYLLYHNKLPFQLLLFQALFDFDALLAMGVLSFFTVVNLL